MPPAIVFFQIAASPCAEMEDSASTPITKPFARPVMDSVQVRALMNGLCVTFQEPVLSCMTFLFKRELLFRRSCSARYIDVKTALQKVEDESISASLKRPASPSIELVEGVQPVRRPRF